MFVVGNEVLFSIPKQWGIQQLNNLTGLISAITSNTFTVNINSQFFDPFVTPVVVLPVVIDPAQVMPAGNQNYGTLTSNILEPNLLIPGSYENTFP